MFIGCFSAATIAAAAEIPAGGGYSSVLAGGDYQTEAEVMVGFQTVAVGCANYSGGLTICYDAYEIVSIPPWSDFGDWAWSRIVETRIPVRRTVNGIDGGTNYEYTTGRIVLRYFCPAGYPRKFFFPPGWLKQTLPPGARQYHSFFCLFLLRLSQNPENNAGASSPLFHFSAVQ